jgi:hypothetical protein
LAWAERAFGDGDGALDVDADDAWEDGLDDGGEFVVEG